MLRLIREHRSLFLGTTLAALALRLFFLFHFPAVTDDSRIYADFGANWLQHDVYGQTQGSLPGTEKQIAPTDTRLPAYPAFLALIFQLFGVGNFRAAMLAQIAVDLATCLVIADFVRRAASDRAARIAFVLAALCPFLASYASAALTETLEIFFTALALDFAAAASVRMRESRGGASTNAISVNKWWAATGAAIAACILLRPDGGILLAAVLLYLAALVLVWERASSPVPAEPSSAVVRAPINPSLVLAAAVTVTVFALAPLVPWTIRNFHTLHHFQPLAPRYANETDELVPRGFNRWIKTWIVDYVSVEEIYWNVPGDPLDPTKLPSRAFENAEEKNATLAVIAEYNQEQDLTPAMDARFGKLASDRIRAHPVRYYIVLPFVRIADMWLRPRTELLPADVRWWEFNDDVKWSAVTLAFGLLNLAYVGAALGALIRGTMSRRGEIHAAGLLVIFLLLRSAFLGTLENPEPRYTLECYPAIIAWASSFLAGKNARAEAGAAR